MRRRDFISLVGGAVAMPLAAQAQQPARMRRVGVLMTLTKNNMEGQARLNSLSQGLEVLGWIQGRNLHIDARWPGDDLDRLRAEVADFANSQPDVIVAGGSRTLLILQQQIQVIPIVFVAAAGTAEHGIVTNTARPAGNLTGFTTYDSFALVGKLLGGLKELRRPSRGLASSCSEAIPVCQGIAESLMLPPNPWAWHQSRPTLAAPLNLRE